MLTRECLAHSCMRTGSVDLLKLCLNWDFIVEGWPRNLSTYFREPWVPLTFLNNPCLKEKCSSSLYAMLAGVSYLLVHKAMSQTLLSEHLIVCKVCNFCTALLHRRRHREWFLEIEKFDSPRSKCFVSASGQITLKSRLHPHGRPSPLRGNSAVTFARLGSTVTLPQPQKPSRVLRSLH